MIHEIGEWVLREACRQCAAWQRAGLPSLRVAVNISAPQFRRGDLLERVRGALEDASSIRSFSRSSLPRPRS